MVGYALREREVVGSIPAVPHRTWHTLLRAQPGGRGTRAPPTQAKQQVRQSKRTACESIRATQQRTAMNRERASAWKKMRAQQTRRKKARMRTALEVIRRLEWDPACCAAAVVVGYRDFGEIVERPLEEFSRWGSIELAGDDELAIPQHRVVYFKSGDAIVWDKRCRLDGVYGSTGHVKVDLSEIAARRRGWRPNHE